MNRRSIFKLLGFGAAAAVVPKAIAEPSTLTPTPAPVPPPALPRFECTSTTQIPWEMQGQTSTAGYAARYRRSSSCN